MKTATQTRIPNVATALRHCTQMLSLGVALAAWIPPAGAATHYVWQGSTNPVPPYTNWATAAHEIQAAVDATDDGDLVLVTNGVYSTGGSLLDVTLTLPCRVAVTNDIEVRSVNGPAVTVIVGQFQTVSEDAVRCVGVMGRAVISGFTLTNGGVMLSGGDVSNMDLKGGGALIAFNSVLTNCVVTTCTGSGIFAAGRAAGSMIVDCVIRGNQAKDAGGGIHIPSEGVTVSRCWILENVVTDMTSPGGGGIAVDTKTADPPTVVRDCVIAGNSTESDQPGGGGGVLASYIQLLQCSIFDNRTLGEGGGVRVNSKGIVAMTNCVVYQNQAVVDDNIRLPALRGQVDLSHVCTYPDLSDDPRVNADTILTNAPLLAGYSNPHLTAASPCRAAGAAAAAELGETDIDGEPRVVGGTLDIGCDQYISNNISGPLSVAIRSSASSPSNAVAGVALPLVSAIEGKVTYFEWVLESPNGWMVISNTMSIQPVWTQPGSYLVLLLAANSDHNDAAWLTVNVTAGFTSYVSHSGGHVPPFTTWQTAATNIQAAVDVCAYGGTVMLDSAVFREPSPVVLNGRVTVQGRGAASATLVDGSADHPCFQVRDPGAVVANLTITNGAGAFGGGIRLFSGTLRGCAVSGNQAANGGGAMCDGDSLVEDCLFEGNRAGSSGGGVYVRNRAIVQRSVFRNNSSDDRGGGAILYQTALMRNCFLTGNSAPEGGGALVATTGLGAGEDWAGLRNCTLTRNRAEVHGGGVMVYYNRNIANCIIYYNEALDGPDCAWYGLGAVTVSHCCASQGIEGEGNITNAPPQLAGWNNPHIVPGSPCQAAGTTADISSTETDYDGEPRIVGGAVAIGCDELILTNLTDALTAQIEGHTQVVVGAPLDLRAITTGRPQGYEWQIAQSSGLTRQANVPWINPVWTAPGQYSVVLVVSNLAHSVSQTVTVTVAASPVIHYVSLTGGHVPPFTTWQTAATNVQAAVDAAFAGGSILIAPGTYSSAATLEMDRFVSLYGTGASRDSVILDGGGVRRVLNLRHDLASLNGVTLAHGYDQVYAGLRFSAGVVSNCVITSCRVTNMNWFGAVGLGGSGRLLNSSVSDNESIRAAGVHVAGAGVARDCLIAGNRANVRVSPALEAAGKGGGALCEGQGRLEHCMVSGNLVGSGVGGGVYLDRSGAVFSCVIYSNAAIQAAGIFCRYGGWVQDSTVDYNWAFWNCGGVWLGNGGTVTNCRIVRNFGNDVKAIGGGVFIGGSQGRLLDSLIASNNAALGAGVAIQSAGAENPPEVFNCDISFNLSTNVWNGTNLLVAGMGAGVYILGSGGLEACRIHHNYAESTGGGGLLEAGGLLRNCLVYGNWAGENGGGIRFEPNPRMADSTAEIQNCTITANYAVGAGGVYFYDKGALKNSIVYGNSAFRDSEYINVMGGTMDHCCTWPDDPDSFTASVTNAPSFANPTAFDFHLLSGSPCVNMGANGEWTEGNTDFEGNPRIRNAVVDIGAYESPWWGVLSDIDDDGYTDWQEVNVLGTNPTNKLSRLELLASTNSAAGPVIRWQSVAGKLYKIDRSSNLGGSPTFTNLVSGIVGLANWTSYVDTSAAGKPGPFFYRVGVPY